MKKLIQKSSNIFDNLAIAFVIVSAATPQIVSANDTAIQQFKVGQRTLEGRLDVNCAIEGTWANGEHLFYLAWDECSKITVNSATLDNYKNWEPRGAKGSPTVADIPPGLEVIEISAGHTSVLIYQGLNGDTQEVLIRD